MILFSERISTWLASSYTSDWSEPQQDAFQSEIVSLVDSNRERFPRRRCTTLQGSNARDKMFKIPAAKRLKRSELFNDNTDAQQLDPESQDEEPQEHQDHLAKPDYGFEYQFFQERHDTAKPEQHIREAEEYQFNLFKPSSKPIGKSNAEGDKFSTKGNAGPTLISLRSPSPDPTSTSVATSRPSSYYFIASLPQSTLTALCKSYLDSAISGTALFEKSQTSWPGTSLPWRVIHLPTHRKQLVIDATASNSTAVVPITLSAIEDRANRHHCRPSKKRRDLLKQKAAKRQAIIDESKTKEEHEREKRNRKNRERKLKRRAKERREKDEKRAGAELSLESRTDEEVSVDA